jgi:hypothetical protein
VMQHSLFYVRDMMQEHLHLPSPKALNSRLGGRRHANGRPSTAPKFIFPPARPNSPSNSPGRTQSTGGIAGAPPWRENVAGQPCRWPEPEKHKYFLLRLATTSHPRCHRRNHPSPRRSIDAGRNPLHRRIQSAATLATSPPLPTVVVHPLPPPLLPPPHSHLAREVFGYLR